MQDECLGISAPAAGHYPQSPSTSAHFSLGAHTPWGTGMASVLPTIIVVFFLVVLVAWIVSAFTGGRRGGGGNRR